MRNETQPAVTTPASSAKKRKAAGELLFEIFCASIFLGMIGLVFYNAFLRYVFRSSFPPSEEWARFLFTYITFFGGIEAFYRRKHIAVDMFVDLIHGKARKAISIAAIIIAMVAMAVLFEGGILYLEQTLDVYAVATGVNMAWVNGTLPIMAGTAFFIMVRDLIQEIRKPLSAYQPEPETGNA